MATVLSLSLPGAIAADLPLAIVAPSLAQSRPTPPPDYFPLKTGDWWKYKTTSGNGNISEYTLKVLNQEKQPDGSVYFLVETLSTQPIHDWYSKPNGWVLMHRMTYPNNPSLKAEYQPVKQFLKNPPNPGDTWNWHGLGMMGVAIQENNQVVAAEEVMVPAGKFRALKVVTQVVQGGTPVTKTYWYANFVGLVKSMTTSSSFTSTAELVDYSLKPKK